MTNKTNKLVNIDFRVGKSSYQATVFLNQPTIIIIPDQNIAVCTSLSPKPDSSTRKNRYRKVAELTEKQEATVLSKTKRVTRKSIFDFSGNLNRLNVTQLPQDRPYCVKSKNIVIAQKL